MSVEALCCLFNLKKEEGRLAYYLFFFVTDRSNEKENSILTLIDNNQQFLLNLKKVSCKLSCAFHFQELFIFRLLFALYN